MTEQKLQNDVCKYLDLSNLLWCHVPNGGKRSKRSGRKMKLAGAKKGAPDCLIFDRSGEYVGIAIELKVDDNDQSEFQQAWQAKLVGRGWLYFVCRSLDEVIEIVNKHYHR